MRRAAVQCTKGHARLTSFWKSPADCAASHWSRGQAKFVANCTCTAQNSSLSDQAASASPSVLSAHDRWRTAESSCELLCGPGSWSDIGHVQGFARRAQERRIQWEEEFQAALVSSLSSRRRLRPLLHAVDQSAVRSLHTCCHASTPGACLLLSAQLLWTMSELLDLRAACRLELMAQTMRIG